MDNTVKKLHVAGNLKGEPFRYEDFTEEQLEALKGEPGNTPYIGENGNWWIDGVDTGQPSRGESTSATLPEGGTAGQLLSKTESGEEWIDPPVSLPQGGTEGQVLTKTQNGEEWRSLPSGGTGSMPELGHALGYDGDGKLAVQVANEVEEDNTLPITAAAVHTTVGNIEILLSTI